MSEQVQPVAEVATTEVTPEVKKDEFASNFEKITKQEKHNAEIRKQLEEKRKTFEADKAELERYRSFDKQLKDDPLGVLEKLGLSYDRIQQIARDKQNPQNAEARRALERVDKLEQELKAREEREKNERLSKEEIRLNASIAEEVRKGGFDVIEQLGQESAVRDFMETYYEETGEIPEISFACEAIAKDIASKIAKVSKSKWLQPKEEIPEVKEETGKEVKTLSNKMIQSSTKEKKPQTEEERTLAAIRILNGG